MLRDKEELDSVAVASKRTTTNLVRVQKEKKNNNKKKKQNERCMAVVPLEQLSREREREVQNCFFFFRPAAEQLRKTKDEQTSKQKRK